MRYLLIHYNKFNSFVQSVTEILSKVQIRTHQDSPRLTYTLHFIFTQTLRVDWQIVHEQNSIDHFSIVSGSKARSVRFLNWQLLNEAVIKSTWSLRMVDATNKWLTGEDHPENLDLLAIVFFYISRYEEYLVIVKDHHERFSSLDSIGYRTGSLEIPVVDQIINYIAKKLDIPIPARLSQITSTIDVDLPWYRKHLKLPWVLNKLSASTSHDPYDTYESILKIHESSGIKPLFFFLAHGNSEYEKVNRYARRAYEQLIRSISRQANVGNHPPYYSMTDELTMRRSVASFKALSEFAPIHSRQHYLRLKLPDTYRFLINSGIKYDHSMGFADHTGFRAGTSRPFLWFDLDRNLVTDLTIVPFVAMDVTLRHYMKLSPDEAFRKLMELKEVIKEHHGQLGLIWHNSSLSDIDGWSDYRRVYVAFIHTYWKNAGEN